MTDDILKTFAMATTLPEGVTHKMLDEGLAAYASNSFDVEGRIALSFPDPHALAQAFIAMKKAEADGR